MSVCFMKDMTNVRLSDIILGMRLLCFISSRRFSTPFLAVNNVLLLFSSWGAPQKTLRPKGFYRLKQGLRFHAFCPFRISCDMMSQQFLQRGHSKMPGKHKPCRMAARLRTAYVRPAFRTIMPAANDRSAFPRPIRDGFTASPAIVNDGDEFELVLGSDD